ncbi:MAG: DUF4249 family protein [Bacteroidota bacterium]
MLIQIRIRFLLAFLLLLASCIDEIELVPEKDQLKGVAINASLIKGDPSIISVLVKPIFTFSGDSRAITPVDEVYLQNEQGEQYLIENRVAIGQYWQRIDPSFDINYEDRYQIVAKLADGRVYESAFVQVRPKIPITSLNFEIIQQNLLNPTTGNLEARDFIQYTISTPVVTSSMGKKPYLRWKSLKTNRYLIEQGIICYTTQSADVNYIGLFDGNQFTTDTLTDFPFFTDFVDGSFSDTYYFTVLQESLTEEAYQYWNQVSLSINRDGNMFEPAAGLISTNIRNASGVEDEVQGFFYATEQSVITIRICPSDVGRSTQIQVCNGCLCQRTEPPLFWELCD